LKKYLFPILSLFIITVIVVGLLAFTNQLTENAIKKIAEEEAQKAMAIVLPGGAPFEDVTQKYDLSVFSGPAHVTKISLSEKGYVLTLVTNGYGGKMLVFVGLDKEGKIVNIMIGDNSETPNLGTEVENEEFTSQFIGLSKDDNLDTRVDNVARATVSSEAVKVAVKEALDIFKEVIE